MSIIKDYSDRELELAVAFLCKQGKAPNPAVTLAELFATYRKELLKSVVKEEIP